MPKILSPKGVLDLPEFGGSMPQVRLGKEGRMMGDETRNYKWFDKDDPTGTAANVNIGGKSFKKGGTVKKTGVYKLHKGEKVIPAKKPAAKKLVAARP
jgi:hypothetical protein